MLISFNSSQPLIRLCLTIVFLFAVTSCAGAPESAPDPLDDEQVNHANELDSKTRDTAELVYKNRCISCHGSELQGRMGEKSNLQKVGKRRSYEEIISTLREGKGMMPAMKERLNKAEIEALGKWLSTKK